VKTSASLLVLLLFLSVFMVSFLQIRVVKAEGTIHIRADGSIDPVGAPIQRDGDIYTLTGDADGINVNRSNMTLDGNGHTLSHTLFVGYVTSVTIKNFIIIINSMDDNIHLESCLNVTIANNTVTGSPTELESRALSLGIDIWGGTSNVITGNLIIGNINGIAFESTTSNNKVFGNNITGNHRGLSISASQNNSIYNNNFDNNTLNVFITGESVIRGWEKVHTPLMNTFDNGTTGNYWSNYNGTDNNSDGIGDTPYIIDENNRDNYPLMKPVTIIPEFPSWTTIYIRADGSVEGTGVINQIGNVYTFFDNINGSIIVEKDDVVIDGAGYTLRGKTNGIALVDRDNVTIKNFVISIDNFGWTSIYLQNCSNCFILNNTMASFPNLDSLADGITVFNGKSNIIAGNRIMDNAYGIRLTSSNTSIFDNNITGNIRGIHFHLSSRTYHIYHNNFINNTFDITIYFSEAIVFDNGVEGNYWSNYNGTDNNGDGIGDTPYIIDENNQDNYPLVNVIPEFPSWTPLLIMLFVLLSVAVVYRRSLHKPNHRRRNQ